MHSWKEYKNGGDGGAGVGETAGKTVEGVGGEYIEIEDKKCL